MIFYLLLITGFSLLLVKATDWIVGSIKYFAKTTGLGKYSITGLVLAFATSLPEFSVAIAAALEGSPSLVLGNVIGSNIVDLSLVVGGGALISGSLIAHDQFLKGDAFYAFLAGALPMLLLLDRQIGTGDGIVLLVVYLIYNATILREEREALASQSIRARPGFFRRAVTSLKDSETERRLSWFILGVATLLIASDGIVRSAVGLADSLAVPPLLIGLVIVSLGTSLPELAFEIKAIRLGESAMALGNLMGSVVTNATLILGVTALIRPIRLDGGLKPYLTATIAYIIMFAGFYGFVRTKKRLERWEGALLVGIYLAFLLIEAAT